MIRVLFICHGNICRSTMAEFVFKDMVRKAGCAEDFYIESAATSREEIGHDTDPRTKRKLEQHGIPYTKRRARQITKNDYDKYDYIIAMDDSNVRDMSYIIGGDPDGKVYKLLHFAGKERDISDPWYTGDFDATYDDIIEGCEALLEHFREEGVI